MLFLCRRTERGDLVYNSDNQQFAVVTGLNRSYYNVTDTGRCCGFNAEATKNRKNGVLVLSSSVALSGEVLSYFVFDYAMERVRWIDYSTFMRAVLENPSICLNFKVENGKPKPVRGSKIYEVFDMDTTGSTPVHSFYNVLTAPIFGFKECLRYSFHRDNGYENKTVYYRVFYNKACVVGAAYDNKGGSALSYYGGGMAMQAGIVSAVGNGVMSGCSGGIEKGLDGKKYISVACDVREGVLSKYKMYKESILDKWLQNNSGDVYAKSIIIGEISDEVSEKLNKKFNFELSKLLDVYMFMHSYKHMSSGAKSVFKGILDSVHTDYEGCLRSFGEQECQRIRKEVISIYRAAQFEFDKVR